MPERETRIRTIVLAYFPMFIATLSLITSIYNGYLNNKFVELIQRNIGRTEAMRTCKEVIDAYFQAKFRAGVVGDNGERARAAAAAVPGADAAQIEAMNAVNKVGALGTYLADLGDDRSREDYTRLTAELEAIVKEAPRLAAADLAKRFEPADMLFGKMNADCVRTARQ